MKRFFLALGITLTIGVLLVTLGTMNIAAAAKGQPLIVPYNFVKWATPIYFITAILYISAAARNIK